MPLSQPPAPIHAAPHATVAPPEDPADALSPRARRRLAAMLRFRLLELREERLDRVRAVLERRLSHDTLDDAPPASAKAPLAAH